MHWTLGTEEQWSLRNGKQSPATVLAYCLESASRPQCRQGKPRWSPVVPLNQRDKAARSSKPRLLQLTGQRTREEKSCTENSRVLQRIPVPYSAESCLGICVRKSPGAGKGPPEKTGENNIQGSHMAWHSACPYPPSKVENLIIRQALRRVLPEH